MNIAPHNSGPIYPRKFPASLLDIWRYASPGTIRLSIYAIAIAFLPCLILATMQGFASLKSFLLDYAAQSRFWIVIPLLIAAEPALVARHDLIAHHFLEEKMATGRDCMRIEQARVSFLRLGRSPIAAAVLVLLVYVAILSLLPGIKSGTFQLLPWVHGSGSLGPSYAGSWYLLVDLPIVGYLLLRWCWRQILWARFLQKTARTALRLIPAHPDAKAGLGFVEICLLSDFPFGFVLGTLIAGGIANRIVSLHASLLEFKYVPLVPLVVVLIVCVSPLFVFTPTLLRAKRQGVLQYGSLATALGQRFEDRWLKAEKQVAPDALDANDFSATTDLYSIVANVDRIIPVLCDIHLVGALCTFTLVPLIPVLFVALPFDVILERIFKLFL